VRLSARVDYALRALCALAVAAPESLTTERVADSEGIPARFLEGILRDLRRAGIVASRRGPAGGHALAVDARAVTVADVIRGIDGPLALVRNLRPEQLEYSAASAHLQDLWVALRAAERQILEGTTVADVVAGRVPVRPSPGPADDASR
jgi:Rrf2 family protein